MTLAQQAARDLDRVRRRRQLLRDAEERLRVSSQAYGDSLGYRMALTENNLDRLLNQWRMQA